MSVWDFEFESADLSFGDALVKLHRITSEKKAESPHVYHSHGYYELHFITKGQYVFHFEDKGVAVARGQMLIIPPTTVHEPFLNSADVGESVLMMSIEKQQGNAGFYKCFTEGMERHGREAIHVSGDLIRKIIGYCMFAPSNSVQQYCQRKLAACDIMVSLFQEICGNDRMFYGSGKNDFDMMLETFINDHRITLPEMAERLGYSGRQLTRIIKKRYGMTLTQLRKGEK